MDPIGLSSPYGNFQMQPNVQGLQLPPIIQAQLEKVVNNKVNDNLSNVADQPGGLQVLMGLLNHFKGASASSAGGPNPDFSGATGSFSGGMNPNPNPGGGPGGGGSTQGSGAGGGFESNATQNSTTPQSETKPTQPNNSGIDLGGLGVGLMMGGMGLQGKNPMEVMSGLATSQLAKQQLEGKTPIQAHEKATLLSNESTRAATQIKAIVDKITSIKSNPLWFMNQGDKDKVTKSMKEIDDLSSIATESHSKLNDLLGTQDYDNLTSSTNIPTVKSNADIKNIKPGSQYTWNGKVYTRGK